MKHLKADDIVAGWTGAQWVTVFRNETPAFSNFTDALNFKLRWLQTKTAPDPYRGKDLNTELIEASLILENII